MSERKRVCIIGAGPCGMAALCHFSQAASDVRPEVVCYEKQATWGGLWNFTWLTGTDEFGEPCHGGQYKHLWSNGPKECLEFPDYTFDYHFRCPIPSFPPRAVLRDYLEGRWTNGDEDLRKYIKFTTVVRSVVYNDASQNFTVVSTDLQAGVSSTEVFTHVIVAVGIFNVPNKPNFDGIDKFEGRIMHSHDFRDAKEFKGQRLLVVGASYSAEDLALQCLKFGAKSVICTWRTKPMGFKWPIGIEERPLLQHLDNNTAYFKDGSSAEVDAILLCTGYRYAFPFLEDRLRLQSRLTMYPDNMYKATLWLGGGGGRLFYLGVEDQYFTFTMFETEALWCCRYIMGTISGEPKSEAEMRGDADKWVSRRNGLKSPNDDIDFQADFIADMSSAVGYNPEEQKVADMLHKWKRDKVVDIVSYRDKSFRSVFSGIEAPLLKHRWWKVFDDSKDAFLKNTE
ncbi:flavin-containing monooxygenase 3-like isoform X1 [Mya arenaria]|uniref:flavin-containing monooxygenase 3-like isoform X1 n=1 Tax=Mya arenaria TaxID=6604 RepID=UPI0022E60EF7|nr:flavin-containing monooxygenase 3-like isoform X1 [Mya arenaria]